MTNFVNLSFKPLTKAVRRSGYLPSVEEKKPVSSRSPKRYGAQDLHTKHLKRRVSSRSPKRYGAQVRFLAAQHTEGFKPLTKAVRRSGAVSGNRRRQLGFKPLTKAVRRSGAQHQGGPAPPFQAAHQSGTALRRYLAASIRTSCFKPLTKAVRRSGSAPSTRNGPCFKPLTKAVRRSGEGERNGVWLHVSSRSPKRYGAQGRFVGHLYQDQILFQAAHQSGTALRVPSGTPSSSEKFRAPFHRETGILLQKRLEHEASLRKPASLSMISSSYVWSTRSTAGLVGVPPHGRRRP